MTPELATLYDGSFRNEEFIKYTEHTSLRGDY